MGLGTILGIAGIALRVIPALAQVMIAVETLFGPKTGKAKKAVVEATGKSMVEAITDVSTGGQTNTWNRIGPSISNIIDHLAAILFPHDEDEYEDDQEGGP